MKKQIRLNAFAMNCVAHQSPGLWTHPRDRTAEYNRLPYWIDLAKTLERGRFDGLFLADVLGVYDVFGNNPDAALRNAAQTPCNDPMLLIPAMAAVTEHLGFGVTSNLSYEPPYPFARRMSTLDHLTEGRVGWNVVTGYLDSAARAPARTGRPPMTTAMRSPTNIWMWSTSSGREAGRTTRRCAIGRAAFSPILRKCIACSTREPTTVSTPSISASRRRNARRCSTRPAPRRADGSSPPSMPNACSCRGRPQKSSGRAFPRSANSPPRAGAMAPKS